MGRLTRFFERLFEDNRVGLVVLLLIFSVTGVVFGLRYKRYADQEPRFCASCHLMQESFDSWGRSAHRDIICQECHRLSLLEQNRLLVSYVTDAKADPRIHEQKHGRVEPWLSCRRCHFRQAEQGSVSSRVSFGHARHVFMHNIECIKCHHISDEAGDHNFGPNEKACAGCHGDKLVHGMGMEGLSCLKCHSYGSKAPGMVSPERCTNCHKGIPDKGIMSGLTCFDCHKPHGKIKLASNDCLKNCHGNETKVGQHGLHMEKAGVDCLDCHKAHTWQIGTKQAKGLCDRCHPLKDPRAFIY